VYKTKSGDIIGTGEDTVYEILKELYKEDDIKRQYKFCELMSKEFKDTLGERQLKETIDLIVFRKAAKTLVVRVQDKHHAGLVTSSRDVIQKQMLEWNNCIVVDAWYNECPEIWKEELNDASRKELINLLKTNDIYLS
jgi:hypothetical protein|tara:strand:- start:1645 stop:2058 length:414 start_codon:yes stop_codon:yes gene_type:complete